MTYISRTFVIQALAHFLVFTSSLTAQESLSSPKQHASQTTHEGVSVSPIDSTLGFFPLHNGDIRQFNYRYFIYCTRQSHSSYFMERVLGDTVLATGYSYKVVESGKTSPLRRRFIRIDTATANVYEWKPPRGDELLDSLRSTPGSTFQRGDGRLIRCTRIDTMTILGSRTVRKQFEAVFTGGSSSYFLAYGFGYVRDVSSVEDGCYPVWNFYYTDLTYATIDGHTFGTLVAVDEIGPTVPTNTRLEQNYPNPFNPTTNIKFTIPKGTETLHTASLRVFDLLGREVATLVNERKEPGDHSVEFDARGFSAGVYFYRLQINGLTETKRMLLVK